VPAIPAVEGSGILVNIPAFGPLSLPPSEVPVIVPDGSIENPVAVIGFDLVSGLTNVITSTPPLIDGPDFNVTTPFIQQIDQATLVIEAEQDRATVARLQPLQSGAAQSVAQSILRPGAVANLPAGSSVTRVLHAFNLDLYYADTGEKISAHDLDLLLALCLRNEFWPETPTVLRLTDEQAQTYEILPQQYSAASRTNASYIEETSIFAVVTIDGNVPQIDPILLPGRAIEDPPPFCTPNQQVTCQCSTFLLGVADIQAELVSYNRPPKDIVVDIPPAPGGSFNRIPVPSGTISEKISVVNTDFGTDCEDGSLLIPASPDETIRVEYKQRPLTPEEKQASIFLMQPPAPQLPNTFPNW
jgi:hypothetical protein